MLLVRFDASFSPRYGTTQPVLGWTCKHHRELGFARDVAASMTKPAESAASAADLLEDVARASALPA